MVFKDFRHQPDAFIRGDIRQAYDAAVRCIFHKNKRAEILIHGHQDPSFGGCPMQQHLITRIWTPFAGFHYIMILLP